jgi:NAD(P)H-nitrite reductase large subunit
MRIGVVGAGHAGVEAARRASQLGAQVVLFSREPVLPYFRPKVVALAFGQVEPDGMYLRPEPWYREHGIELRLNAAVTQLDAHARSVTAGGHTEKFDALVLATGASPALLPFARQFPDDVLPLWGAAESLIIKDRLVRTRQLLILGGGISGVEAALYAREAGLDVTVVEKMGRLMAQQLGIGAAGVLTRQLQTAGVNVLIGRYAVTLSQQGDQLHAVLDDGSEIACDLILTTAGTTRKLELFEQAGLKTDRGIVVDEHQQTSVPGIFACGDIAQRGIGMTTVVRAVAQGRGAGENAIAFAQGRALAPVPEPLAPLLFKHQDVEIQAIGPAPGEGVEERVLMTDGKTTYRSVLLDHSHLSTPSALSEPRAGQARPGPSLDRLGTLRGIQMIGRHEDFRRLAAGLGQPWEQIVV